MPVAPQLSISHLVRHRSIMSLFRKIPLRMLAIASGTVLAVYWLTLLVLTHLPPEILSQILLSFSFLSDGDEYLEQGGDKTMHLVAYAGLAFLFTLWLWIRGVDELRLWKLTIFVLGGYAILDELLQIPVRRTADVGDCLADWAGVTIGSVCFVAARVLIDRLGIRQTPPSASADAS